MRFRNVCYYTAGLGFLILANIKHRLYGYATPKPFSGGEVERCIDYDIRVVDEWLSHLADYTRDHHFLGAKNVLELGPGSDLGIGLYLLALGAAKYNACDVNPLAGTASDRFYHLLFKRIQSMVQKADVDDLIEQYQEAKNGRASKINYVVREDFRLSSALGKETIDLVFSQAAFEHFDDIDETVAELSKVCKSGAVIIAEIDLKTHSRWIREKDPNNIYRYHDDVYRTLWRRGFPNRIRPYQYKAAFEKYGWTNIAVIPLKTAELYASGQSGLAGRFHDKVNQMDYLSIMFCATKK